VLRFFKFSGSYPKKLVKLVVSTASNEAGVFRFEAAGIVIKGWRQKRYQPYAARIAGIVKAAMPLAPPWCSGRTPALGYRP